MPTYKIVRIYADERPKEILKRGLTLEEAKEHCSDPKTRKPGEWFDAFYKEFNPEADEEEENDDA